MNIQFFDNGQQEIAYLAEAGIAVHFSEKPNQQPASKPTYPVLKPYMQPQDMQMMYWGDGNDFPQLITSLYSRDTVIPTTLGKMAASIIEGGIYACQVMSYDEKGNEVLKAVNDPEINAFLNAPWFRSKYLHETANDMVWFFNAFPELILSRDRTKIVQILPVEAYDCRWSVMNEKGKCEYVYVNANWPMANANDAETTKIPAIDPYVFDAVDQLREGSDFKYIYPVSYPTPGRRFYQLAHHDSIRTSGWLELHQSVPEFKKFVMENQMSIKFHWKVDTNYWPKTYGDRWDKGTPEVRRAIKKEWLEAMSKTLTTTTNAGNSIMTDREWDTITKQYKDYVEIIPVTDPIKDGKYLLDAQEAALNILYAIGVDASTIGFVTSMTGARSGGSDKREGWLIDKARLSPFRDFIIEPLNFIANYNGWQDRYENRLVFRWRDTILTTLDTGAGTAKTLS